MVWSWSEPVRSEAGFAVEGRFGRMFTIILAVVVQLARVALERLKRGIRLAKKMLEFWEMVFQHSGPYRNLLLSAAASGDEITGLILTGAIIKGDAAVRRLAEEQANEHKNTLKLLEDQLPERENALKKAEEALRKAREPTQG